MIENGTRRPSVDVAMKIGNVLEFDWTIFFGNKGNETLHFIDTSKKDSLNTTSTISSA
ncbi:hypothetical protein D3C75_1336100 [compost metagenome]